MRRSLIILGFVLTLAALAAMLLVFYVFFTTRFGTTSVQ
jgi:flagellar basal body-associated protein FliL